MLCLSLHAKLKERGYVYIFVGEYKAVMENVLATWNIDGRVENDVWVLERVTLATPEIGANNIYFADPDNGVNEPSEYFEQLAHIL